MSEKTGESIKKMARIFGERKDAMEAFQKIKKKFGKPYPHIIEYKFELIEIIEYLLKETKKKK